MSNDQFSFSEQETFSFGQKLAATSPQIIALYGDLGSGKTTLVKGFIQQVTGISKEEVTSPTFTYVQTYNGPQIVHHFDLYRIKTIEEFLKMGFDEYFDNSGICCIEWAERIETILPPFTLKITISSIGKNKRSIEIS